MEPFFFTIGRMSEGLKQEELFEADCQQGNSLARQDESSEALQKYLQRCPTP